MSLNHSHCQAISTPQTIPKHSKLHLNTQILISRETVLTSVMKWMKQSILALKSEEESDARDPNAVNPEVMHVLLSGPAAQRSFRWNLVSWRGSVSAGKILTSKIKLYPQPNNASKWNSSAAAAGVNRTSAGEPSAGPSLCHSAVWCAVIAWPALPSSGFRDRGGFAQRWNASGRSLLAELNEPLHTLEQSIVSVGFWRACLE